MLVALSTNILLLLAIWLANINWVSCAKQYGYSHHHHHHGRFPASSSSEESSSSLGGFQSSYDQEEERVLLAMANAEKRRGKGGRSSARYYNHSSRRLQTNNKFSEDVLSSSDQEEEGVGNNANNDTNPNKASSSSGHKTNLAVNPTRSVQAEPSPGRSKRETMASSLPIPGSSSPSLNTTPIATSPMMRKKNDLSKKSTSSNIPQKATSSVTATSKQKASSNTTPWIRQYLSSRPKDVLLPVPKEFIADGFNVAKLGPIVERIGFQVAGEDAVNIAKQLTEVSTRSYPIYRLALQLILAEEEEDHNLILLQNPIVPPQVIHVAAEALYLMVHSRFCQSARGLDSLKRIVRAAMFGKCPRTSCGGAPLLPYGMSNDFLFGQKSCRRYCPKCGEVWSWWDSKTDGCAFGPSLCHLFLMTHGAELFPLLERTTTSSNNNDAWKSPFRVMGFRIHPATMWGSSMVTRSSKTS